MEKNIKVGFCIAYDWSLLQYALPMVYEAADLICLSLDRSRRSWSGNPFAFDEIAFRRFLSEIDTHNKISVYEDDFFVGSNTPMQNEVRQRNMMAAFMKKGGWHIQLDCDEYFVNFGQFVKYLMAIPQRSFKFNVCCALITLFKEVDGGFLYILPDSLEALEYIQVATRTPDYQYGRRNGDFNYYTNFRMVHQSWARSDEEIYQKVKNWGHISDFDVSEFLQMWSTLTHINYKALHDFHPIEPARWSSLSMLTVNSIQDVFTTRDIINFPGYSAFKLALKNSLFLSRVRALWSKVF